MFESGLVSVKKQIDLLAFFFTHSGKITVFWCRAVVFSWMMPANGVLDKLLGKMFRYL